MAIFAKVIKYEGNNSTFVSKHPSEDFNTASQLIVHESQEAVFFANGQALDLFTAGRYTLETQNIPLLSAVINIPTGGKTPFHCEVYFINKAQQLAIKWGTDSQVQYMEPTYRFPLQIGLSGEMAVSVADSRKLLVKLVGTEKDFTHAALRNVFRAFLNSKIKPYIAKTMQNSSFSIFETDSHMDEISADLEKLLKPDFSEYGLKLEHFFVTNIAKPDGEPAYEQFKSLHIRQYSDIAHAQLQQQVRVIDEETEKKRMIIQAEGAAEKRRIEGYTYGQERSFDIAESAAKNEGAGNYSALGIGLGLMGGVAQTVGGMANEAVGGIASQQKPSDLSAFKQRIEKLILMQEMGLLTAEEFDAEKKKLLNDI